MSSTEAENREFDRAHRALMFTSRSIALDAIAGRLPSTEQRDKFAEAQARFHAAAAAIGLDAA